MTQTPVKASFGSLVWRLARVPFSPGGRNFLLWQIFYRTRPLLFALARLYRSTLARRMRVITVVGTFGKTTTTRAIFHALGERADRWMERNANTQGTVAWSLLRQPPWRKHVVIETGVIEPGVMAGYGRVLRPDIVVVTCIGSEHLDSFEDLEHLRAEKAAAVRGLSPDAVAILNHDDPHVRWMAGETRARVVWYGYEGDCDLQAGDWENNWPHGGILSLASRHGHHRVQSQLTGRQSSYALLAAMTVAMVEDRDLSLAAAGLATLTPTPSRMQRCLVPGNVWVLRDDFKATLETVHAALDALAGVPGRIIVVLGGIDSPPKPQRPCYRAVAARAASLADEIVIVGQTWPLYAAELERQRKGPARLQVVHAARHVAEATAYLRGRIKSGDVVFIKGRKPEHLARIALALEGREVRCSVEACRLHFQNCDDCALLSRSGPTEGTRLDDRVVTRGR